MTAAPYSGHIYNAAVDLLGANLAAGRGRRLAFVDPARTLTFGELDDRAARVGPMLARLGIQPEDRVALALLDTVDFPVIFLGAIRAGVIPVLFNTRLTVAQYRYLLEDSRARAIFVSPVILPDVLEAAQGVATLRKIIVVGGGSHEHTRFEQLLETETPGPAAATSADEVAYWLYSSGTTGMPKGVMHVHSTPRLISRLIGDDLLGIRATDVCFSTAKMFFSYGLSNSIFCPLGAGATTVLYPERPTPRTVFEMLHAYQASVFYAVPTLYASVLGDLRCTPATGSQQLRLCVSAGEPLPAELGVAWRDRFGVDILNGVGSTEMGHLFLANRPGHIEYGTSGIPPAGFDVRLVDEHGRNTAAGEIGEMLVRGPTAAAGYWNQRARSRSTFQGEWTATGDKYLCRDDCVYVYCGRIDDMFKVSGIWVSPHEVEAALMAHPRVLDAAVIPSEDGEGLVKPKAYVVLRDPGDDLPGRALYEELKVHVKVSIGPWKYPRWIEFVDSLPRTATGKLQRHLLRAQSAGRLL